MRASRRLSGEDGRRFRALPFALAAAVALACHLAVLGGLRWTWERPVAVAAPAGAPIAAVQVRAVLPVPMSAAKVEPPPVRIAAADPARRRAAPRAVVPKPDTASPPGDRRAATPPAAVAAPAPDPEDEPPPVYRTRLPPSMTLRFDVGRGPGEGTAELRWRRDAEGYAIDWQGRAGDAALPTQSSRGGVDAAGIAPLRFVDQRPSRAALAVNFQRDAGRITFSRKAAAVALAPGAQDRLSWLLQLAAVVAAEPELRERGREVRITVAGAGGDVAVWRLRCEGLETLAGGPALHYLREARGPYDTRAEVWLGAEDGRFLPVQAGWRTGPSDEGVELRLREVLVTGGE